MRSVGISIATFVTLATAIPHVLNNHTHGRRAHIARFDPLADRTISYDGSCGSWSGASCLAGFCCGPNGWCGDAKGHCGAGCQAGFGHCGLESSPESTVTFQSGTAQTQSTSATTDTDSSSSSSYTSTATTLVSVTRNSQPTMSSSGPPSYGPSISVVPPTTYPSTTIVSTTVESTQSTASTYTTPSSPSLSSGSTTTAPTSTSQTSSFTSPVTSTPTTTTYGGPVPTSTSGGGDQSQGGPYINLFKGDGSTNAGWPAQDQWLSFETLWTINQDIMQNSCSNAWSLGSQSDNTPQELAEVKSAIHDVAAANDVDEAFVYVVMQQESLGCVRVRTTVGSHGNPGLFQSNQGTGSCNPGSAGTNVQIPCPETTIHQMVEDGVAGTSSGDGLKQLLGQATGEEVQKYFRAARMYNSGSVDPSGDLGRGVATHCYCSDIANRLLGWSQGPSQCSAEDVGV